MENPPDSHAPLPSADAPPSSGQEHIFAHTSYRIGAEVVSKIASLAFYVVVAREVGDSAFGIFTFALALVTLVTTLGNFGQDAVLVREVAPRRALAERYFANTLVMKAVICAAALAVTLAALVAFDADETTTTVVALLGVAVALETLMSTCFAMFQSFDRQGPIAVVLVWQRVATTAVGVPLVLATGDVTTAAAVYLGGAVTAFVLAFLLLAAKVVRPRFVVTPRDWWPLMVAALPVGIGIVFSTTLFRIDTAMLEAFEPDEVVGHYGTAYRLFESTLFLSWSVGAAVFPVFARITADTRDSLAGVHERSLKLGLIPTMPLALGALILGTPVITLLYGDTYEPGGTALMLLAPAIALYPLEHLTSALLIARRRQRAVAIVFGLVAAQNIAANFVLIPWLSLNGAALNTSISELILVTALLTLAHGETGALDWRRAAGGPVLAAIPAGLLMLAFHDELALAVLTGAAAYLLVVALWERRFFPEDARMVSDFLLRRAPSA